MLPKVFLGKALTLYKVEAMSPDGKNTISAYTSKLPKEGGIFKVKAKEYRVLSVSDPYLFHYYMGDIYMFDFEKEGSATPVEMYCDAYHVYVQLGVL